MLEKAIAIAIILLLAYGLFVCVWLAIALRRLRKRLEAIIERLKEGGTE